jgi:hypothetical protein
MRKRAWMRELLPLPLRPTRPSLWEGGMERVMLVRTGWEVELFEMETWV